MAPRQLVAGMPRPLGTEQRCGYDPESRSTTLWIGERGPLSGTPSTAFVFTVEGGIKMANEMDESRLPRRRRGLFCSTPARLKIMWVIFLAVTAPVLFSTRGMKRKIIQLPWASGKVILSNLTFGVAIRRSPVLPVPSVMPICHDQSPSPHTLTVCTVDFQKIARLIEDVTIVQMMKYPGWSGIRFDSIGNTFLARIGAHVLLVPPFLVLLAMTWRTRTWARKLRDPAVCRCCGYDTAHLVSNRCPECGTATSAAPGTAQLRAIH